MSVHVENQYYAVSFSLRESKSARVYVHDDPRTMRGYKLSYREEGCAKIRDLTRFVQEHRYALDAYAARHELGTLAWDSLHVTAHRVERHEESFDWSGLINSRIEAFAPAI